MPYVQDPLTGNTRWEPPKTPPDPSQCWKLSPAQLQSELRHAAELRQAEAVYREVVNHAGGQEHLSAAESFIRHEPPRRPSRTIDIVTGELR